MIAATLLVKILVIVLGAWLVFVGVLVTAATWSAENERRAAQIVREERRRRGKLGDELAPRRRPNPRR